MPPVRAERLAAVVCAVLGVASLAALSAGHHELVLAVVLAGALAFARSRPWAAWLVALAALLGAAQLGAVEFPIYLLVCAHAFCLARWSGLWAGLAATAALIAALELGIAIAQLDLFVVAFFVPASGWFAGRALGERERIVAQLSQRARELQQERDAHTRLSVRYERARIASELHDVVAHALSVMVVQALAGQRLAAHEPALTVESFKTIANAAHQAEADLGRLVALLADEHTSAPALGLGLVRELVARATASGLDVTLRVEGDSEGLPAPQAQAAYRILQEGLTNALRHAPGATVAIVVRGEPATLVVELANGPATGEHALAGAGTGNGLRGLREIADAFGGTLEAGPAVDGGWRLKARLSRRSVAPGR